MVAARGSIVGCSLIVFFVEVIAQLIRVFDSRQSQCVWTQTRPTVSFCGRAVSTSQDNGLLRHRCTNALLLPLLDILRWPHCATCRHNCTLCCCRETWKAGCVSPTTLFKATSQLCCLDCRTALPPDREVPCAIALCGLRCCGSPGELPVLGEPHHVDPADLRFTTSLLCLTRRCTATLSVLAWTAAQLPLAQSVDSATK